MNADAISKQISSTVTWVISHPFAALLWISAVIIATGLAFGLINPMIGNRLPTFGITPQSAIYPAGIVYLLWGKV